MEIYHGARFVAGLITAGYLILGVFFLRFWRCTLDQLFLSFAATFWLLALNEAISALAGVDETLSPRIYLIRLAAFIILAAAIARKNLTPS